MKKLILLTILLNSLFAFSQKDVSYFGYVPLKTYHFVRDDLSMSDYTKGEGGNIGLIISRRVQQNDKVYTEKQFGALNNSYGYLSFVFHQGVGVKIIGLDIGMGAGLITGYKKLYRVNSELKMPPFFVKNGIMVSAVLNIAPSEGVNIGKLDIKPMLLISPSYLNIGIAMGLN